MQHRFVSKDGGQNVMHEKDDKRAGLKRGCIEFKYSADGIHSGLTPPGNNT